MVLFKTSPVIPRHITWLGMLLLIGILGLISQVWSSESIVLYTFLSSSSCVKTLLVMGLQRETASRGSLAIYTSVCLSLHGPFVVL